MQYTESEIVKEYNQAKYKNKKIGILSQLNTCSRAEIIQILERNGIEVPDKYKTSAEEEYDYSIIGQKDRDENSDKQPTQKPVKSPKKNIGNRCRPISRSIKAENITKEVHSASEKKAQEEYREPMSANLKIKQEDNRDGISEATYHLVQIGLARIDHRITKIERKQKKLKRLYKQLAKLILG